MHGLAPVIDATTRLVILGSFPGGASLAAAQYYAHPQNHFWRIVGTVLGEPLVSMPYTQRLECLLARQIGLWDVYQACDREGSLDSAIRNARVNDFAQMLTRAPELSRVCHNGKASARFAPVLESLGLQTRVLPSTSPANASWSFEAKLAVWREALSI
ncbi:MAG TPA: DNA-deoxyinosine glycosylase [Burkholderiaceae bacterium]|nr:DNA-deoxyinosine glycosylase [Burkholderiaceae bacterium]